MRRDPLPLLIVLLLVLLGSVAWLTRHPGSPALDRMVEWPVVGPWAERFRDAYRPAAAATGSEEGEPAVDLVVVDADAAGGEPEEEPTIVVVAPRPARAWLRAGTRLRAAPAADAPVVETVVQIRTINLVERRGEWRRVKSVALGGAVSEGWVRVEELGSPSEAELQLAEPVLPLPSTRPDPETLALARELMGGDARDLACGPFLLVTDLRGPLVESCPRLAGQLDGLYAARTGLAPVSEAAEAVLLFDSHAAFLVFRTRTSPASTRHAFAAPARGFIATAAGGRLPEQIRASLVHELIHLLNRRHLGPALPPWLDEGLAEEVAISRIEADGTLLPGTLGHWQVGPDDARVLGGGRLERDLLRGAMLRGALPTFETMVALDTTAFQAEALYSTHYALSAFWVRYLLSAEAPGGGDGFRSFLAAVAAGEPLEARLLLDRLGASWDELETGFRRWLDAAA